MYYLYLLKCSDDTLYAGITTDLARRVAEHNSSGKGAKYTRGRRPVVLVYSKEYENRSEATKAEREIRKLSKEEKWGLIGAK